MEQFNFVNCSIITWRGNTRRSRGAKYTCAWGAMRSTHQKCTWRCVLFVFQVIVDGVASCFKRYQRHRLDQGRLLLCHPGNARLAFHLREGPQVFKPVVLPVFVVKLVLTIQAAQRTGTIRNERVNQRVHGRSMLSWFFKSRRQQRNEAVMMCACDMLHSFMWESAAPANDRTHSRRND